MLMQKELLKSFVDMDEAEAVRIARELVETEGGAVAVLDTCKEAMEEVGRLFEAGEYFLSELIAAVICLTRSWNLPYLSCRGAKLPVSGPWF